MPKEFKQQKKATSSTLKKKMLCPHCGYEDFHVVKSSAFSWLFGERFKCEKCNGTFKKAALVKVNEKNLESEVNQKGSKVGHKIKHKHSHKKRH